MLQTIVTYEKATSIIISIAHVDSLIQNATVLKVPGYEVLISTEPNIFEIDKQGVMRLKEDYLPSLS